MRYIESIAGSIIALIVFAFCSYYISGFGPSDEVQIILTVSSFLFAILAGFFISRFNSRFDRVRESLALEDARFLSLYEVAVLLNKKLASRIADLIDKYYIIAYDILEGKTAYKENAAYFLAIYDELNKAKHTGANVEPMLGKILDYMADIEASRNTRSVLVTEKVTAGQWLVLFILAAIVIFSVYYMQIDSLYSRLITILLSTAVVLVILILRDLQNLRLGGQLIAIESGEEVFDAMGKPRYYNQKYLADGSIIVPDYVKQYRLGLHRPGETPKLKLVKNNKG